MKGEFDKEAFGRLSLLLVNCIFFLFGTLLFAVPEIVQYKFEIIGLYIAVVTGQYVHKGLKLEEKYGRNGNK